MPGPAPLVVACVAPADLRPDVDRLTGEVRDDPRRSDLSPSDAAAVEHALRAADAWGGRVLAAAAGPAEIDPVLAALVALDVDVVRVEIPAPPGPRSGRDLAGDPAAVAAALASVIRARGEPALVVCGDRSAGPGPGVGAVPALLAHRLGLDQALGLVSVTFAPTGGALAERRLDGGWRERIEIRGPAVISVEAAGVRLRRAALAAALAAASAPVAVAGGYGTGGGAAPAGTPGPPEGGGAGGGGPGRAGPSVSYGAPRPWRPRTMPVGAPLGDVRQRLAALTGALSERSPARVIEPLDAAAAAEEILETLARAGLRTPAAPPAPPSSGS